MARLAKKPGNWEEFKGTEEDWEKNTEEDWETSKGRMRFYGSGGKRASEWAEHHYSGPGMRPVLEARKAVIRAAYEGCLLCIIQQRTPGVQPRTPVSEMEGEVLDYLVLCLLSLSILPIPYTPRGFILHPRIYILKGPWVILM